MNLVIRNAQPTDVTSIIDVYYKTWLATYPNAEVGITEDDIHENFKHAYTSVNFEKRQKRIVELPANERYLVAEEDGKIVGLCRVVLHTEKNQIQAIYVLPEFQGKRIGSMLWDEACKSFNPKLQSVVEVATYNTKAIAFYKKRGFVETGKVFTEERFRMKSGNIIPETELVKPPRGRDRSAGIVIKDGKILLMHRINKGDEYYVIPGGGIEKGESPEETTVREIYEEMSVVVKISRLFHEMTRVGGEHDYYYECEYVSGEPALRNDSPEFKQSQLGEQIYEPMWIELGKVKELLMYPVEVKEKILITFVV